MLKHCHWKGQSRELLHQCLLVQRQYQYPWRNCLPLTYSIHPVNRQILSEYKQMLPLGRPQYQMHRFKQGECACVRVCVFSFHSRYGRWLYRKLKKTANKLNIFSRTSQPRSRYSPFVWHIVSINSFDPKRANWSRKEGYESISST